MSETKKCPYCGETIMADASKCRYCKEWLGDFIEKKAVKSSKSLERPSPNPVGADMNSLHGDSPKIPKNKEEWKRKVDGFFSVLNSLFIILLFLLLIGLLLWN